MLPAYARYWIVLGPRIRRASILSWLGLHRGGRANAQAVSSLHEKIRDPKKRAMESDNVTLILVACYTWMEDIEHGFPDDVPEL